MPKARTRRTRRVPPRIITFYSYKGGTGRSMALANVAWILAANGKRVLAIDWDLEAPGLHRYFHPFLHDTQLVSSDGVVDFVLDFAMAAVSTDKHTKRDWYKPYANMLRCASSLNWKFGKGTLDFIPAGRFGVDYATRVNSFDWQDFYERLHGGLFLEATKQSFDGYDYVLIDSRTGVSDTSGICTVQMPDVLVVCFTLNSQSIDGVAAVAESADAQRRDSRGKRTLRIFPVPMRVERAEQRRLDLGRQEARERLSPLLWHLDAKVRDLYWERIEVAYQPFYAYEEVLATFADPPAVTGTLLSSFETLTQYVTGKTLSMPDMAATMRNDALGRFARGHDATTLLPPTAAAAPAPATVAARESAPVPSVEPAPSPGPSGPGRYTFYVSYASLDLDPYLARFIDDLSKELRKLLGLNEGDPVAYFDQQTIGIGGSWPPGTREALGTAKAAVCIVTPAYVNSRICAKEFGVLLQRAELGRAARPAEETQAILPVLWGAPLSTLPHPALKWRSIGSEWPDLYSQEGLRYLLQLRRHHAGYVQLLRAFARRLADAMNSTPLQLISDVPALESAPEVFTPDAAAPSAADPLSAHALVGHLTILASNPDWTPFTTPVGVLATEVASRLLIPLQQSLPEDTNFESLLPRYESTGRPVIIVVDVKELSKVDALERAITTPGLGRFEWPNLVLIVVRTPVDSSDKNVERRVARLVTAPLEPALSASVTTEAELRRAIETGLSRARANIIAARAALPGQTGPQMPRVSP